MSVEADPNALAAKQAITEVLFRYCRGLDRMDEQLAYSVWHPDGTAHYSGLFEGSGRAFVDWVNELHEEMESTSHQVTNVLIELAEGGRNAVSEAYVTVRMRTSVEHSGFDIVGVGRYLDEWSCRDGTWAIDHRRYVGDFITTVPVPAPDDRPHVEPAAVVGLLDSSRDRHDPSYDLFD